MMIGPKLYHKSALTLQGSDPGEERGAAVRVSGAQALLEAQCKVPTTHKDVYLLLVDGEHQKLKFILLST